MALPEVDETDMLTVWFPVLDATVENGCLCVVPESHKRGLLLHCPSQPGQAFDLRIPEEVRGAGGFPVPMKRGSAIFLHRRTMHSSLSNKSDGVRWSFDLRYQPVGQPTGRPWFPAFVARSRQDPSSEVRDWRDWAKLWKAPAPLAHEPAAMKPRRWTGTEPLRLTRPFGSAQRPVPRPAPGASPPAPLRLLPGLDGPRDQLLRLRVLRPANWRNSVCSRLASPLAVQVALLDRLVQQAGHDRGGRDRPGSAPRPSRCAP